MSTFAEDLADGEYELIVEAMMRLREIKVQAWRVSQESPLTQRLTRADFGIDSIDAMFKKLDVNVPEDAVPNGMPPRIGIRVEGGAIQNVFADQAATVYVIDYDVEDATPPEGEEEPEHGVCDLEQDGGRIAECVLSRYGAQVAPEWFPRMDRSLEVLAKRLQDREPAEGMKP